MNKKCTGCGAVFQCENINQEGYIKKENIEKSKLCERCFRIIHYNEYQVIEKDNEEFISILKEIDKTDDLVILVIDLLNINKDLKSILSYLHNNILAVYTKRDLLPLLIKDEKILSYNEKLKLNVIDSVVVSSKKNYQFDLLLDKIMKYKTSDNVYVIGYSNTGKSTLINKLIKDYSINPIQITTSMLPSTTIGTISIPLNDDLTIIDTPGILESGSIINFVDANMLKKILPKKEIRPITYQVKKKQFIWIEDILELELENDNNFTFYLSNQLKIERKFKQKNTKLKKNVVRVKPNQDIVIAGLGFIKVSYEDVIIIYTLDGVDVYTRDSLI